MGAWDNKRLSDIAARSQILIEGVKVGGNNDLNVIIRDMFNDLRGVLSRTEYKDLSVLSKKQLAALLRSLELVRKRAYSRYTETAMEWLRDFCDAQANVQRRVWAYSRFMIDRIAFDDEEVDNDKDEPPVFDDKRSIAFMLAFLPLFKRNNTPSFATDDNRLWTSVVNAPSPANGMYPLPSFQSVIDVAGAGVLNEVRKSWTTPGATATGVIESLTNESPQGASSLLQRTLNNSRAALNTVAQQAAMQIAEAVSSILYGRYRWDSIIDSATTDICRSRNRKTYTMGQGPLPPAHYHCRSHITPIEDNASVRNQSLYTWLREQPRELLVYLFGEDGAELVLSGASDPSELPAIVFRPLSPADYMANVRTIIN